MAKQKPKGWLDKYASNVAASDATRTSPALNYRSVEDSERIEREKELARRKTSVGPQSKTPVAMKQAAEERYAQEKRNEKYKNIAEYAQIIGGGLEVAAPFTGPLAPIVGGAGTLASAGSSAYLAGRDVAEENYGSALMNAGFGGLGIAGYTPAARATNVGGVNVAKAADAADYVSDVAGTYNAYDEYGRSYANKVKNIKETNWGKDYWEKLYAKDNELSSLKLLTEDRFSQLREYEKSLLKDLGIGKNLGGGSYGQVYEYANDPSTVIKLGRPMSYGSLDAKNWTPEFIESANNINKYGNIAVPKNVKYFESPSTWNGTHEVMEMPNLNQSIGERLDLNKRDRYALFLKQARQLRDKGIKLDVANPANFSYNKEKNIFDIYDVNPGFIHRPGHYMQHVVNRTKGPLLENMPYKNGGWLDKYNDGGPVQPNYNDYNVSASPDFQGDGYSNVGRNYSPAWGGQFAMGGSIPGTVGFTYARTIDPAPSKGKYAKKTMASAQNGQEMQFYQEGLDFKPKSISKKGSVIKDDMGQWNHPGEITEIGSNQITMQGVPYPVMGISDTGDTQMMYPNQEYQYDGNSVTEYPMMQDGGILDPIINLGKRAVNYIGGLFDDNNNVNKDDLIDYAPTLKTSKAKNEYNKFNDIYYNSPQRKKVDRVSNPLMYNDVTVPDYSKDENRIKLTTGRFANANVSSRLIDDIAAAAKRNNISVGQLLTLAGRESTFGQEKGNNINSGNPTAYTSGWNIDEKYQPYEPKRFLADKKVPGINVIKSPNGYQYKVTNEKAIVEYLKKNPQLINEYKKKIESTPDIGNRNTFDLSAEFLKEKGVKGYNPRDPNYEKMFNQDYDTLKQDKALMSYLKKNKYTFEDGGQLKKLDQLTNFTNYNPTQPSGWLEKYQ